MKSSLRAGLGVFGLVVLGGLACAGVFVFFGSQLAVYAAVAIAPMLFVVGGLWVRRRITATGTDQAQYTRRRAREVGESFTDAWETRERIRREYPAVFGDGLGLGVDTLVADLSTAGIEFDRDSAAFTLGSVEDLETINSLGTRVESLETEADAAFGDAVVRRIDEITAEIDRLDDLARTDAVPDASAVPEDDWTAAGETLEEAREAAIRTIDSAAETIQSAISAADDVDRATVEGQLADARDAAADHRFSEAVTALLDARDAVRREGETTFSAARAELRSLLDTVAASDVDDYLTETSADVSDIERAVADLDDAMELSALTEHRSAAKDRCLDVVTTLERDLAGVVETLENADVPDGYYTVPPAHDRRYADELRQADGLSAFESTWQTAVNDLTAALDDLESKADVVSGYDHVRDQIESELRATGRVDAGDLPVREHEEQFLGLYYRENPDSVEFDIEEPSLSVAGGRESHEVTVTVQFERGGPDREVTVELDGGSYSDTATVTTPLVGTATFEDVPFGEYTVTAVPDDDDFGRATEAVDVQSDTELELELREVTLRDRLCDGIESEAEQYLDELESTFADRMDDEGYLSSAMSYRVDEEYVPCLLVLWADRTGHAAAQHGDGRVVVYDESTLRGELENVVAYNLEAGESIGFDELREKFLSAPVSDAVLSELSTDGIGDVTVTDSELTKS